MLKHLLGESQSQPEIKSTKWSILKFKNNISIPCIVHVSFGKSCIFKGCNVYQQWYFWPFIHLPLYGIRTILAPMSFLFSSPSSYVSPWLMQAQPYHPTSPYLPTLSLPSTQLANLHSSLLPLTIIHGKPSLMHCSLDMTYLATLTEPSHVHPQKSQSMANKSQIWTIFFGQDKTNFFF